MLLFQKKEAMADMVIGKQIDALVYWPDPHLTTAVYDALVQMSVSVPQDMGVFLIDIIPVPLLRQLNAAFTLMSQTARWHYDTLSDDEKQQMNSGESDSLSAWGWEITMIEDKKKIAYNVLKNLLSDYKKNPTQLMGDHNPEIGNLLDGWTLVKHTNYCGTEEDNMPDIYEER